MSNESPPSIPADPAHDRNNDVRDDGDSAVGDDGASSTASISASILEYRKLHGRTYQNFTKNTESWQPNDSNQNEVLDIIHHMMYLLLDNRLYLAPISDDPQKVLDIGTGTGIWAIDFADQFPSAEVIGTDLSPIQPQWVPPNCKFELDDATQEWTYPENSFDFIHIRHLTGCISDWTALYQQAYRCLKPGGWIEHNELGIEVKCDDGTMTAENSIWPRNNTIFLPIGEKLGRSFRILERNKEWMEKAGFKDIQAKIFKVPVNGWSSDAKYKEIGQYYELASYEGCEGSCLFLLHTVEKWEYAEVQAYLAKMRKSIRDKSVHAYNEVGSTWAMKPLEKE